jgi:hypothetical protein
MIKGARSKPLVRSAAVLTGYTAVASLPTDAGPIIAIVQCRKSVLVATVGRVFERGLDGVFRECRFERIRDGG